MTQNFWSKNFSWNLYLFLVKNFRNKNIFEVLCLGRKPNFLEVKFFFWPTIFLGSHFCGPKFFWNPKFFIGPYIFWTQNFLAPNFFGSQHKYNNKKNLIQLTAYFSSVFSIKNHILLVSHGAMSNLKIQTQMGEGRKAEISHFLLNPLQHTYI